MKQEVAQEAGAVPPAFVDLSTPPSTPPRKPRVIGDLDVRTPEHAVKVVADDGSAMEVQG